MLESQITNTSSSQFCPSWKEPLVFLLNNGQPTFKVNTHFKRHQIISQFHEPNMSVQPCQEVLTKLKGCWLPGEKPSSIKIHWTNPGQKKLILTIQWDRGSYCELTLCRLAMLVMGIQRWTRCSPCSQELGYFPLADSHPPLPHFTIPFFSVFCNLSLYKLVSDCDLKKCSKTKPEVNSPFQLPWLATN